MSLCECGCGERAPIARTTRRRWGHVKGQPMRFVKGHGSRKVEWVEEDRGYGTPCFIWQGSFTEKGYPTIYRGYRTTAHRWLYEEKVGPIPEGHDLDHLCEVKACVNWTHVEPVTRSEHNFRTWARKRERAA